MDNEEQNRNVSKWILLEILYKYSFNLPIFSFGEDYSSKYKILEKENLKGFFVLKIDSSQANKIKEYGIDEIKNIDIEEIKQNNII
ncbi:MAG: hypothetical protein QXW65_02830 [Candidatus Pacearchaeota archaeon]